MGFVEQRQEIAGGQTANVLRRTASQAGQHRGHMWHIGRVVGFTPERHRRQIGAVGFNQQAIVRYKFGHFAQISRRFEGQDARERDVKTQIQSRSRDLLAFGEAMEHPACTPCSACFALFFQDGDGVV